MSKIIISRCWGNKRAWTADTEGGFCCGTDLDLGRLVERVFDKHGGEIVLEVTAEGEAAARAAARREELRNLSFEVAREKKALAYKQKRMRELEADRMQAAETRPGEAAATEAMRTGEDYGTVAARMNMD